MKCTIDWNAMASQPSPDDRINEVARQTNTLLTEFGTIPLTECLQRRKMGGQLFIVEMDRRQASVDFSVEQKGIFRLKLLRHESKASPPPKPGDVFSWVVGYKTTYIDGEGRRVPMNTAEMEKLRRFCKKPGDQWDWRIWRNHTLDDDCCFTASFHDAMALLINKSILSDYDEGGDDSWYWLVEEVTPDGQQIEINTDKEPPPLKKAVIREAPTPAREAK